MRTVIATFSLFFGAFAFSAPGAITSTVAINDQIRLNQENSAEQNQLISLRTPTVLKKITASVQVESKKTDYKDQTLIGSQGQEILLSSIDSGERQIVTVGVDLQLDNHKLAVSHAKDVDQSEFASQNLGLSDTISLYSGATQIGFKYAHGSQKQPINYYIDINTLQSRQRISEIKTQQIGFSVEQIWTDVWKTQVEFLRNNFKNYRPEQNIIKASQAYAISNRWTYLSQIGLAAEKTSENLYDDRGYFKAQWFDQNIVYEFQLDSFVSLGWSTLSENENDPRRGSTVDLGTDSVGLSIQQQLKNWGYQFKVAGLVTSENQRGQSIEGGLLWQF